MNRVFKSLIFGFCFLLCGCVSAGKFTQTLSSNWGMSSRETKEKIKLKPFEEGYLHGSGIKVLRYSFLAWGGRKNYILYFKDGGLVRYSDYTEANHYESMYELGVISRNEYMDYLNLRQKDLDREIQMNALRQQQEFQRQMLDNQEESLSLQREAQKKKYSDGLLNSGKTTTNCSPDGRGGFNCQTEAMPSLFSY